MAIPVVRPPLAPGEGKTIFWKREELVCLDNALCQMLYIPDSDGEFRFELSPETKQLLCRMIDKINRHI